MSKNRISEAKRWKVRKLRSIKDKLPMEWQDKYREMTGEVGEHKVVPPFGPSVTLAGPFSPITVQELSKKSPAEILDWVHNWSNEGGHAEPSPTGLARVLDEVVAERPLDFSQTTAEIRLEKFRPIYGFHFFNGLAKGVKADVELDWESLLELMERLILAESLPPVPEPRSYDESDWDFALLGAADLLDEGLKSEKASIPFRSRDQVWGLIKALLSHPQPDTMYEKQYGPPNSDGIDLSLNVVRGRATHAVINYALWVNKANNKGLAPEQQSISLPVEVQGALEDLVEPDMEPTITVRAVLGYYLDSLMYLDSGWVKRNFSRLFPEDTRFTSLKREALKGYFSFARPRGLIFKNLRPLFKSALTWVIEGPTELSFHDPQNRFIECLMVIFWWGHDPIDDENSITKALFQLGSSAQRAHAIEFIGQTLENFDYDSAGATPALTRLKSLYDWRLATAMEASIKEPFAQELRQFGWWFVNGQLDLTWQIHSLVETLELTAGLIESTEEVVDRLYEFVDVDSTRTARVVELIVSSNIETYKLKYFSEKIGRVLSSIKGSEHDEAWDICTRTIDVLGRKGLNQFGELL